MNVQPRRVLDLFSGIGAYSLGLQRTGGFEPVAFCEIDVYCRKILAKHWPNVYIYEDVKTLTADRLQADGIVPDWIVAGWPCQGNSPAGTGLGMDDPRSGLWSEIRRLAGELRPKGLLLENSSNLLNINDGIDFGRVLGDLATLGYDSEWHCLPAAAFDAPHIRDRVWIIATRPDVDRAGLAFGLEDRGWLGRPRKVHARRPAERMGAVSDVASVGFEAGRLSIGAGAQLTQSGGDDPDGAVADPDGQWELQSQGSKSEQRRRTDNGLGSSAANPASVGRKPRRTQPAGIERRPIFDGDYSVANIDRLAPIGTAIARQERVSWRSVSDFRGMVHGAAEGLDGFAVTTERVPNRVKRIHALGNCNPPIIPELIARAIIACEGE